MKIQENRNWPLLCVLILIPIPMVWNGFACLKDPCIHGICIDDLVSNYFCYCIDGYTGIHCQTNWNECWSSPCQNGGICIDGIASFNCSCPPGYTGKMSFFSNIFNLLHVSHTSITTTKRFTCAMTKFSITFHLN